ncbi:hypothetical protein, partial [Citrobacter braakii]|uniref:hypothetical protein n=1 Tax=Citrobacter braakii TaxID=57706 RepID=UPI001C8CCFB7
IWSNFAPQKIYLRDTVVVDNEEELIYICLKYDIKAHDSLIQMETKASHKHTVIEKNVNISCMLKLKFTHTDYSRLQIFGLMYGISPYVFLKLLREIMLKST